MDGAVTRVTTQLFDFFEAQELQNDARLAMGSPSLDYKAKVQLVLDRWAKIDPGFAKLFREKVTAYYNEMAFLDRAAISDLDDRGDIFGPKDNCTLKSAAVFRTNPLPGEKSKLIDKNIWAIADNDTRAGLILHEVIYSGYKRNLLSEDSRFARYFVVFITSSKMDGISAVDYRRFIESVGFGKFTNSTIVFNNLLLSNLKVSDDGFVSSGWPELPATVHFQGQALRIVGEVNDKGEVTQQFIVPTLTFDKEGAVTGMDNVRLGNEIQVSVADNKITLPSGSHLQFWENKVILFDLPSNFPDLDLTVRGVIFHTITTGWNPNERKPYKFNNDGTPQELRVKGNLDFNWNGSRIKISGLEALDFFLRQLRNL